METIQLIVIVLLCFTYGTHCTSIRVGHKGSGHGSTEIISEHSHTAVSLGHFDHYITPLKSSLQKATSAICHHSKLCSHEILNEPPFVNLLGPYTFHESHRSPFSFLHDLNPKTILSMAVKDIVGGFGKAEADVLLAPYKSVVNSVKGLYGI